MDVAKRLYKNLGKWLVFLYLVAFPFGQLVRFNIHLFGRPVTLHPVDAIAGLSLVLVISARLKTPGIFRYFKNFLLLAFFSTFLSIFYFPASEVLLGSFFLLRLIAYFYFFILLWNLFRDNLLKGDTLLKSLIAVSVFVALYGWTQYLWLPDLRDLKYIGWDDHYYRIFGTFLDPAFFGIVVLLGALIVLSKYLENGKKYLIVLVFFLFTLLLSYSRASYLAFFTGFISLLIAKSKKLIKPLFVFIILFALSVPFLPRNIHEAAKLDRTYSVLAKFDNWKETIIIVREKPLFGVGFNNLCSARVRKFSDRIESHSCTGSDSSLLLVLATTGVAGFMVFLNIFVQIAKYKSRNSNFSLFKACGIALFVHSLFVNSLFYPWVMGFMGILLAISLQEN